MPRIRGVPAPLTFSVMALADDTHLTANEVSAAKRESRSATEKGRLLGRDGLTWVYVNGRPRCLAVVSRKPCKATPPARWLPAVKQPGRKKKKSSTARHVRTSRRSSATRPMPDHQYNPRAESNSSRRHGR